MGERDGGRLLGFLLLLASLLFPLGGAGHGTPPGAPLPCLPLLGAECFPQTLQAGEGSSFRLGRIIKSSLSHLGLLGSSSFTPCLMTWAREEVGSGEGALAVVGVGEGGGGLIPTLKGVGGQVQGEHHGGELFNEPLLVA